MESGLFSFVIVVLWEKVKANAFHSPFMSQLNFVT